jgi:hypothetical protein
MLLFMNILKFLFLFFKILESLHLVFIGFEFLRDQINLIIQDHLLWLMSHLFSAHGTDMPSFERIVKTMLTEGMPAMSSDWIGKKAHANWALKLLNVHCKNDVV